MNPLKQTFARDYGITWWNDGVVRYYNSSLLSVSSGARSRVRNALYSTDGLSHTLNGEWMPHPLAGTIRRKLR